MEQILKNIICIIIPVLNKEKNIRLILEYIFNKIKTKDILFIDDNSKDNLWKEIKKNCKKYIFILCQKDTAENLWKTQV